MDEARSYCRDSGINPLTTTETIVWNDVVWADGKIIIVGNKGAVYESTDKGVNWTKVTIPGSTRQIYTR